MAAYLERVDLTNYRSCKKAKLLPNKELTTLIGPNGSGKSNLLNGILLLEKIARLTRPLRDEFAVLSACKVRFWLNIDGKSVKYEAIVRYSTNDRNYDEVIDAEQKWNFEEITGNPKWVAAPLSLFRDIRRFQGLASTTNMQMNLFNMRQAEFLTSVNLDQESIDRLLPIIQQIDEFASNMNYYSASQFTDPSKCPTFFEIEEERFIKRRAKNENKHSQFMYDLYSSKQTNNKEFEEFLSLVNRDGVGLIDDLQFDEIEVPSKVYQALTGGRFVPKEIRKLLVIPIFNIGQARLSPNQLSEGTFKTLAIMFYTLVDKSKLFLLEEPEVCVHHGLLTSIVEILKSVSKEKQIIISTHSDFVLDALKPENVFLVSNDLKKGTTVKNISTSMSARDYKALKHYLNTTGNLGEYWRSGALDE